MTPEAARGVAERFLAKYAAQAPLQMRDELERLVMAIWDKGVMDTKAALKPTRTKLALVKDEVVEVSA